MAKTKVKKEDIKEYTTEELVEKIQSEKQRYKKLKFNHAVSPLDNPLVLRSSRRDIARLATEMSSRKKSEQTAQK